MSRAALAFFAAALLVGAPASAAPASAPRPIRHYFQLKPATNTPAVQAYAPFGPQVPVTALVFLNDGQTLVAGGYREVVLWNLAEARLARRIDLGDNFASVRAVQPAKDGPLLAVAGGVPGVSGTAALVDVATGQVTATFSGAKDELTSVALSPDGLCLAATGAGAEAFVWDAKTGQLLATLTEHTDRVTSVAFHPEGKLLLTASADKSLRLWETGAWKSVKTLPQPMPVACAAFGPGGQFIAAALCVPNEGTSALRILRSELEDPAVAVALAQGKPKPNERPALVQTLNLGGSLPLGLAWAWGAPPPPPAPPKKDAPAPPPPPVPQRIVVACRDAVVKVFNPNAGEPVATLSGHRDWVYAAAGNPVAALTRIATAASDGAINVWSTRSGNLLATLVQLAPRSDDWLIYAARGVFAAAAPDQIVATAADGQKLPAADVLARFHQPAQVREALLDPLPPPPAPPKPAASKPAAPAKPATPAPAAKPASPPPPAKAEPKKSP
ncbi:MAG: WD40 repeat domain-containing protein [Opitutae bacterium]|nr:WD40 repeat domain-containing protein [Opitutae bacterium]